MKIGDAVKTMRGWEKWNFASTRLRPFCEAREHLTKFWSRVPDDQPCMFDITVRFPPMGEKAKKAK